MATGARGGHRFDSVRSRDEFSVSVQFGPKFKKSIRFLKKIKTEPKPIVWFGSVSVFR